MSPTFVHSAVLYGAVFRIVWDEKSAANGVELCTINIISTGTLRLRLFLVYVQKSLTQFHTHSLSLFQSLIHSLLTCWTTFIFMSMLKSHSHTLSLSHSFNLSFNHSRHAEQVLFSSLCWKLTVYCWKLHLQCFFLAHLLIITLSC